MSAQTTGGDIAARALTQIGTPFRLHGRRPGEALDCVGLVGFAIQANNPVPLDYSLRGNFEPQVTAFFAAAGFEQCSTAFLDGDIVAVQAAPRQLHLMISARNGFVHAHAGLSKIVLTPGLPVWKVIGHWRIKGD